MSENKNQLDKFIHSKKFVISIITVAIAVFIIVLLVKINNSGNKSVFGFGSRDNINEDVIKRCLQSEIISVKFGNNDMSFSVSTGKIEELKIKEMQELSDRGTIQNVLVNLKWTCKTTSVMGDVKIKLKYGSGNVNIINNLVLEENAKVEYIPPSNEDLRKDLVGEYLRIVAVSNSLKNTKTGKLVDVIFKLENEDIVTAETAGFEYRSSYGIVNANVVFDRVKDRMTVKANVYMYYKLNKDVWKLDKVEPVNGYKSYTMEFR